MHVYVYFSAAFGLLAFGGGGRWGRALLMDDDLARGDPDAGL